MMTSILLLGIFIGMRHAFEADHVAAVAALISRDNSIGNSIKQGAAWGLGHTITLFIFGSTVILMDSILPEKNCVRIRICCWNNAGCTWSRCD